MRDRDAGSGSIWVLILATGLLAVSALVLLIGGIAMARYRTASVADLAALAAARDFASGADQSAACRLAARVSASADTRLVECLVGQDGVANVSVASRALGTSSGMVAEVRSRAGPQ